MVTYEAAMNCYLLAGGSSTRMGRPKLDLPFGASDFLSLVRAAAAASFDEVFAVQRAEGESVRDLPVIREEPNDERAPVFGVLAALRHASARCFVLAIDYPLITSALLRSLRASFENSERPMLVPFWRGKPQLLCAGYDPALAPLLERRIAAGRLDLRGLIEEVAAELIDEKMLRDRFPGEPLMNVNTPEDLLEAENHERQRILASR